MDAFLEKNPSVRLGMIFHENKVSDRESFFPELIGDPAPELSEKGRHELDALWEQAKASSRGGEDA